ncbi:MAG: (Fe-S)-binding protein [Bacteroidota bacterium]|nr:(Fe-S)-binding protein [Bacteroidota bacterium]
MQLQKLSPRVDKLFFDEQHPEILKPNGVSKYRIGFLSGCLMNVAFAKINEDTIKVLLHHDCEVIIPKEQVCCGSLQAHNGDFEIARELAKKNVDVFSGYDLDAIVMNSAGCGALMKEYGEYLKDDPKYFQKAQKLSNKVKDLSEFLIGIGLKKTERKFTKRVTYHDACHLIHAQKIYKEPREIIQSIPGIQYIELNEASWCCGSAGIYNVVNYSDSMKILDRKMENILSANPEYIVTTNPGCITQIAYGCKTRNLGTQVIHLATLLREIYGI